MHELNIYFDLNKFKINYKRILINLFISFIISIIIFIPFLNNSIILSHDTSFHLSRIDGIITALADKQFPIKIYPYKNYGFSYASPLFYSDIFLIPFSLIHHLGLSLVDSYRLLLFIFIIVMSFNFLYVSQEIIKNNKYAIIATILYSFSQYHLLNIFVRGALGEIMGMTFMPLIILACYRLFYEKKYNIYLLSFSMTAILLCHNISFLLSVLLLILLCLCNLNLILKDKKIIISIIISGLISLALSSFFLFPMIEQMLSQELSYKLYLRYEASKLSFIDLFVEYYFSNNFNHNLDHYGIGLTSMILLFVSLLTNIKNKKDDLKSWMFKLLIISLILIIMTTDNLLFIYNIIQFPWRLNIISSLLIPMASIYLLLDKRIIKNICLIIVLSLTMINTISFDSEMLFGNNKIWIPSNLNKKDLFEENNYFNLDAFLFNVAEISNREYLPNAYNYDYRNAPKAITYNNGDYTSYLFDRKGLDFIIYTDSKYIETINLPLTYYKGYYAEEIDINHKHIKEIEVNEHEYYKLVSIDIEEGKHIYHVYYKGTIIQKITFIISLLTFIIILLNIIRRRRDIIMNK